MAGTAAEILVWSNRIIQKVYQFACSAIRTRRLAIGRVIIELCRHLGNFSDGFHLILMF